MTLPAGWRLAVWQRFTTRLRREIAARAGLSRRELADHLRVSYGKVAEFQKRGALHFHAVIHFDGPDGPDTPPPTRATVDLLADVIRAAAAHSYTSVSVPAAADQPAFTFRWGTQLDVRPVKALGDGSDITEQAVAAYVAKATENTGTLDRRIGELAELDRHQVPDHTRRLIEACKLLDPLYPDGPLWDWAHMLGFRGHFSSMSRRYSTTLGARRQARVDYRAAQEHAALGLDDQSRTPSSSSPAGSTPATATPRRIRSGHHHRPRPPTQPRNRPRSPARGTEHLALDLLRLACQATCTSLHRAPER